MALPPSFRQLVSRIIAQLAQAREVTESTSYPPQAAPSNPFLLAETNSKDVLLTLHALFPNELLPALDILDRRLIQRQLLKDEALQQEIKGHQNLRQASPPRHTRLGHPNPPGITEATNVEGEIRGTSMGKLSDLTALQTEDQNVKLLGQARTALQEGHEQSSVRYKVETDDLTEEASEQAITNARTAGHLVEDLHQRGMVYYVRSGRELPAMRTKWRDATSETAAHYEVRTTSWNCSCPAFAFAAFPASEEQHAGSESEGFGGYSLGHDLPMCKHMLACVLLQHCPQLSHFCEDMEQHVESIAGWAAGWGD